MTATVPNTPLDGYLFSFAQLRGKLGFVRFDIFFPPYYNYGVCNSDLPDHRSLRFLLKMRYSAVCRLMGGFTFLQR